MAQLLISVLVIATFGIMLGAGSTSIDKGGLVDAANAMGIRAEYSRISGGIVAHQHATGRLPPMDGWQEAILPFAAESISRLPKSLTWTYVARQTGFGLCVDYPEAGPRAQHVLRNIDCADLPERDAGGLVLMAPSPTTMFDNRPRGVTTGAPVDLVQQAHALANIAPHPLQINAMNFPADSAFRLGASDTCTGTVLAPRSSCAFEVVFSAADNGSFLADLEISATIVTVP
jgi:hypothetical protein